MAKFTIQHVHEGPGPDEVHVTFLDASGQTHAHLLRNAGALASALKATPRTLPNPARVSLEQQALTAAVHEITEHRTPGVVKQMILGESAGVARKIPDIAIANAMDDLEQEAKIAAQAAQAVQTAPNTPSV